MSWCSWVLPPSKSWGISEFSPEFSSSLLDWYSQESSSWSWAGGGAGSGGGVAFFPRGAGLALDEYPDSGVEALAKGPSLSLGREMVARGTEQVSPGVCSSRFKEQGGVLGL